MTDPSRYVGTYELEANRIEVLADGPGLLLRSTTLGELSELQERPPEEHRVVPLGPDTFIALEPAQRVHPTWTFVGSDEQGRARYVHTGRAVPRVD